jgi:hypothetical protein
MSVNRPKTDQYTLVNDMVITEMKLDVTDSIRVQAIVEWSMILDGGVTDENRR